MADNMQPVNSETRSDKKKHYLVNGLLLLVCTAAFIIFMHYSGADRLRQIGRPHVLPLIGAFAATIAVNYCMAKRWMVIVKSLGSSAKLSGFRFFHYIILMQSLGLVVPKDAADLLGRAVWLNRLYAVAPLRAAASVFFDRFFDLMTASLFTCAALPFWLGWSNSFYGFVLLIAAAILTLALSEKIYGLFFYSRAAFSFWRPKPLSAGQS